MPLVSPFFSVPARSSGRRLIAILLPPLFGFQVVGMSLQFSYSRRTSRTPATAMYDLALTPFLPSCIITLLPAFACCVLRSIVVVVQNGLILSCAPRCCYGLFALHLACS